MNISQRLLSIASKVNKGSSIIDVGTDHGYVPIYLYENNMIEKAIAADVSKGSCEKARRNITEHSLEKHIVVIESNGLKGIGTSGFDTLIISGMGGRLICDILDESTAKLSNIEYIILQPQTDVERVRKKLHDVGYKIIDEDIVIEDEKYYNIIVGKFGQEIYHKEVYYLFGKVLLDRKDEMLKKFLEHEKKKAKEILNTLEHVNTENARDRIDELKKYIKMRENVGTD